MDEVVSIGTTDGQNVKVRLEWLLTAAARYLIPEGRHPACNLERLVTLADGSTVRVRFELTRGPGHYGSSDAAPDDGADHDCG